MKSPSILQIEVTRAFYDRLAAEGNRRGLRASAFAKILLEAAWTARCQPTGDEALDAAVAAIETETTAAPPPPAPMPALPPPTVPPAPMPAPPPPLVPPAPMPKWPQPAARPPRPQPAPQPAPPPPAPAARPTSPVVVDERMAKLIRMYRQMGRRPLEISQLTNVPTAEVNRVLAEAAARVRKG